MKTKVEKILIAFILSIGIITSCSKDKETDDQPILGDTYVAINLGGTEADEQIQNFGSTKSVAIPNYQTGVASTNDGCELVYELVKVGDNNIRQDSEDNSSISVSNPSKAVIKRVPLATNAQYRLLVYNDKDSLKHDQIYTYNKNTPININLDAGKEYTFVAYSFNKGNLPSNSLVNKGLLSTATLSNITDELLFYREKVEIKYGPNKLYLVLKYMFSSIETNVKVDQENIFGPLTTLSGVSLSPTRTSASMPLQSGELEYGTVKTNGEAINFPQIPTNGVYSLSSSNPTKLINPKSISNGTLRIGNAVIDGKSKPNLEINNIKIVAGGKYKLNLTFKICTETIDESIFNWDYKGQQGGNYIIDNTGAIRYRGYELKHKVTAKGSDFGYIMNITKLDNSLNMEINSGTTKLTISPSEIQFDPFAGAQNIRFKDGDRHQQSGVSAIYNMTGTVQNPVVRIAIDVNGNVRFFAKKTQSNNTLYEMELFNPTTGARIPFNKVNWKPKGQINEVTVTQKVDNTTSLIGVGHAKNIVSCASIK